MACLPLMVMLVLLSVGLVAADTSEEASDEVRGNPYPCSESSQRCKPRGGVCPDPNSFHRMCFAYIDQCDSDYNCPAGAKCCLVAGCGKECMVVKPGICPVIYFIKAPECSPEEKIDACQTDGECPGTEKCCFHICNKRCVEPR